jgi:hypothetical protein
VLTHPRSCGCFLLSVDELDALPGHLRRYSGHLQAVAAWAEAYLSRPHPDLGRAGPVCPYVPTSLRRRLFHLTVCGGGVERYGGAGRTRLLDAIATYRDWFTRLDPRDGPGAQFKTILILFPDLSAADAPEVIDRTQAAVKPSFVDNGLMIGQFHQLPPAEGGLWNADFRPLRSPVPLLAIRHMVPSDLPFLTGDRRLLDGYRRVFGDDLPERYRLELDRELTGVNR